MPLRFWRAAKAAPADRDTALRALRSLQRNRLLRPAAAATPGSANDEYWAIQAGLSGAGSPW